MSAQITEELKSRGVAQVIVVMKQPVAAAASLATAPLDTIASLQTGTTVQSLSQHFVASEASQFSALAAAAALGRPVRSRAGQSRRGQSVPEAALAPPPVRFYPNLGVMLGTVDREGLVALRRDPRVAQVTGTPPLSLIRPRRIATAKLNRTVTWGIQAMRVPILWEQGITGKGILVGHLDTGVDNTHATLSGDAIKDFAEFDDFGREVTPTPAPFDSEDHGTHTAATIVGRPVSGRHIGVAPGAHLVSAMVIEGGSAVARVLGGMDWAVGKNIQILSMSLGFRGYWDDFLQLTQLLRARNILAVFAVGNEGPGSSRSPGNYAETLSVGAYARSGDVADFSSSQRFARKDDPLVPDLVAPGVGIISAKPGGGYQMMDGSSMATPHIAGLAALLMQAKPDKTVDEVEAAIFKSCKLKPHMPADRANRGVPNAVDALALL